MNDPDLINAAANAAGLSARRLAMEVLGISERNLRDWLQSKKPMGNTARVVCVGIVDRPGLALELAHARAKLGPLLVERGVAEPGPASE